MVPATQISELARSARAVADTLGAGPSHRGGSLTVVGTGIRAVLQLTVESLAAMADADVLLHVVGEPVQEQALDAVNPRARTLTAYYADGVERSATYESMVRTILAEVQQGKRTVAAFYGHPGVFTYPSHESIRRARAAGFPARMLPAVSAEDCLFADLGVDPGDGCQSFEATDFLFGGHHVDPTAHLVIWQVGTVGNWTYESHGYDLRWFSGLVQRLLAYYPAHHPAVVYEAPFHPRGVARMPRVPIGGLHGGMVTPATTLYVPPLTSMARTVGH